MAASNDNSGIIRAPRADRMCVVGPQTSRGPANAGPSKTAGDRVAATPSGAKAGSPGPSGIEAITKAVRAIEVAREAVCDVAAIYGDELRADVVLECTGAFQALEQPRRTMVALRRGERGRDWRGLMDEGAP